MIVYMDVKLLISYSFSMYMFTEQAITTHTVWGSVLQIMLYFLMKTDMVEGGIMNSLEAF